LIIGLGNPILGDDGIGWRVVEALDNQMKTSIHQKAARPGMDEPADWPEIEIDYLSLGGLSLMERLVGYDRVIIVDALTTGNATPGTVMQLKLDDLPDQALGHLCSAHDTSLQNALKVGKMMGARVPEDIMVVGIEINPIYDFSDNLSPMIGESIPEAVQIIMENLK
jgi:hydrogenase maturation protease